MHRFLDAILLGFVLLAAPVVAADPLEQGARAPEARPERTVSSPDDPPRRVVSIPDDPPRRAVSIPDDPPQRVVSIPDDPPRRVVSINVCADQYLLALADPDQIAAVSLYATDGAMAYFAGRAHGYPRTAGNAEEVLGFDPDLVLAGTFTKVQSRAMLRRLGYRVIDLAPADSWEDVRAQTRLVAEALGHPERAARWIAALDLTLAAGDEAGLPDPQGLPLRALQYQRRGFTAGTETLMDRIFDAAGLENAAAEAGIGSVGRLSMESLVRVAPDLVVFDRADIALTDVGSDLLRHPALDRAVPEAMQMALPQRLTVCGGPSLAEAIATLRAAVRDRLLPCGEEAGRACPSVMQPGQ